MTQHGLRCFNSNMTDIRAYLCYNLNINSHKDTNVNTVTMIKKSSFYWPLLWIYTHYKVQWFESKYLVCLTVAGCARRAQKRLITPVPQPKSMTTFPLRAALLLRITCLYVSVRGLSDSISRWSLWQQDADNTYQPKLCFWIRNPLILMIKTFFHWC